MPIFEFQCPKCKRTIELIIKRIEDAEGLLCTEDGCNIPMENRIGRTSFVLKGSGWARDGYSGGGSKE